MITVIPLDLQSSRSSPHLTLWLCACDAIMVLNMASTLDTSFRLAEVLVSDLYATTNNLKLKSSGFFTFDLGLGLRCWTTWHSWSYCPPDQFFWLDGSRGSFWNTFNFSTFLPEHSFILKSYVRGWWVTQVIFRVSPWSNLNLCRPSASQACLF